MDKSNTASSADKNSIKNACIRKLSKQHILKQMNETVIETHRYNCTKYDEEKYCQKVICTIKWDRICLPPTV